LIIILSIAACSALLAPPIGQALIADPPNVLLIVTDDQRRDGTMIAMPQTAALFDREGTEFTRPYTATPLCCPDRGSIRSGRFAHNHGVTTNWSYPLMQLYDQNSTIEHQLRTAGYATALVGKYWNDWPLGIAPPNFQKWAMFSGGYNNMTFSVNGSVRQIPGYTAAVQGTYASQFLNEFEANDGQPWYMYLTPQAPHSPTTPESKYQNAPFPNLVPSPAFQETDISDKPVQVRRLGHQHTLSEVDATRKAQLRTLMSVDDLVAGIFAQLEALGETNTLAIFTSDNGYMWGEHWLNAKRWPYTDSVQIPLFMRWPGHVAAGADDPRLVSHVDIAPTIYGAVGLTPSYVPDGVSLFSPGARQRLYLEYFLSPDAKVKTWSGLITAGGVGYFEWYENGGTFFREYYDLVSDPYQLTNLLGDGNAANDPDVAALSAQLALDRVCVGTACPRPLSLDNEPPGLPGTPLAESTVAGRVDLTWAAADDDISDLIRYRVYRDGEAAAFASVTSAASIVSFADTGSAPGTTHTYSVDALDEAGNVGPRTPESDPVTVLAPPPAIFADDFAFGLGAWSPLVGITLDSTMGSPTVPSARAQAANTQRYAIRNLGASFDDVCFSSAVNLASISSSSVALLKIRTSGNLGIARVYVNSNRGLRIRDDITAQVFDPTASLTSGWHRLELCARIGGSGEIRFLFDGVLQGSWTANVGTSQIRLVQLLDETNKTFTANVDDIVVDQTTG
jgi:arylsulfatase A-like enzyme